MPPEGNTVTAVLNLHSPRMPEDSWDLLEAARLHYEHRLRMLAASFIVGIVAAASIAAVTIML